jgi:hypothetical protein
VTSADSVVRADVPGLVLRRWGGPSSRGTVAGFVAGTVLFALALLLALVLGRMSLSSATVAGLGVGLLGLFVLGLARYELLVALGIFLLAAVQFEPAPADLVFAVAIPIGLATGRLAGGRLPPSVVGLAALFVALNLLSAVEVVDPARASFYLAITVYLIVFALWLAADVHSARTARLVAGTYLAAALLSAIVGSLALFASFPGSDTLVFAGDRARGLFKDPVVFGPFLIPPALLVAEYAVSRRPGRLRCLLAIGIFLTLVVGVLVSYSRAAWLNLVIGLLVLSAVLVVRQGGGRRVLALAAILLAAMVGAYATIHLTGSQEVLAQRTHLQQYDQQRFGAQLFGLEQSTRYPLGIGPGQFEVLGPLSAHSLYVRTMAEQGLLGLATLLALLVLTLGLGLENVARGRDTYGIGSAALLGAWCGLLANSFFVDTLHWRHFWLVAALIWAGSMEARARAPSSLEQLSRHVPYEAAPAGAAHRRSSRSTRRARHSGHA